MGGQSLVHLKTKLNKNEVKIMSKKFSVVTKKVKIHENAYNISISLERCCNKELFTNMNGPEMSLNKYDFLSKIF